MESGHKDCNLAQTSSLISKLSVPLNESKGALLGMDMLQRNVEITRHPDVEPDLIMIDIFFGCIMPWPSPSPRHLNQKPCHQQHHSKYKKS